MTVVEVDGGASGDAGMEVFWVVVVEVVMRVAGVGETLVLDGCSVRASVAGVFTVEE